MSKYQSDHHTKNIILDFSFTFHETSERRSLLRGCCWNNISVLFCSFCRLFLQRSYHLKLCNYKNSILISQRAARYICCIHPNLVSQGAYKWSEGAAPLVSPGFCQTTALIQDDCGCRAIPGWMGPAFRELQGPAVPLLS